jgi:hypothetical protein
MLAIEHIAHEGVILYPPFLTAMQNPADIPILLQEMATAGGSMIIVILLSWIVLVAVSQRMKQIQKVTN